MEDRDLWKWELPNSPEVSAALESHPKDFSVWDQLDAGELAREGKTILRHNRLQVERIVQHSALQDIVGWRVPAVNTPLLASEACEALLEKFPRRALRGGLRRPEEPEEVEPAEQRGVRCDGSSTTDGRRGAPPRRGVPGRHLTPAVSRATVPLPWTPMPKRDIHRSGSSSEPRETPSSKRFGSERNVG